MAIQKNFVVKNGLEVNTNLILADAENDRVGIGTTITTATLHVRGGIAATDLNVGGISTFKTIVAEGPIAAGSLTSVGATGQYLKSTHTGVEWSSFPDFRVIQTYTAEDGQYVFGLEHTPNEIDVFVNGVKLSSSEFTDSSVDVTLFSPTNFGDIVELIGYGVLGQYTTGGSISGITILDEGSPVGTIDMITSINFVGGDVVAAGTGAGVTVTIAPTDLNYIDGDARITGILTVGKSSVVIDGPRNKVDSGTITTKELIVTDAPYSSLDFLKIVDNPISIGSTEIILDSSYGIDVGDKITVDGALSEVSIVAIGTIAVSPYNRTFLTTFTPVNISVGSTAIAIASTTNVSIGNSISIVGFLTDVPVIGFSTISNPGIGLGYVDAVLIDPGFAKTTLIPFNATVGISSVVTQKDIVLIGSGSTSNVAISSASSALIQRFVASSSNINISGIITAGYFIGDGSGLTNLPGGGGSGIGTQWTSTSVGIHTLTNVGIGTTAKSSYSLDVDGDLNFSGSLYQNGSSFVASRWSAGTGSKIYRDSEVGIGTENPVTKLHVEGGLKVAGPIYDYSDSIGSVGYVLSSDGSKIEWIEGISLGAQGLQGTQGGIGVQGILGAQGNEGYVGSDGIDGQDGAQGSQGLQGTLGSQGFQGLQGAQGLTGLDGNPGPSGPQGIAGEFAGQGTQGTQGIQGIQGIQGLDGLFAGQGTQGPQGIQGTQGSQGIQGVKGDTSQLNVNSVSTGSFSVALTKTGVATTDVVSYGNEITNPLSYNASIPGVGIGTANISSSLHISSGKSTPNGAPLKINPGTLLSTPESNAIEYDGLNLYISQNNITNGTKRAFIDSTQFYRLDSDQATITANGQIVSVPWFGYFSGVSLLNGYSYEVEYNLFYTKTFTNGLLYLNFSSSSPFGYTSLSASSSVFGPDISGGIVAGATSQVVTMSPIGPMVANSFGMVCVKGIITPAANCRVELKAHVTSGGITPKKDSYVKVRCLGNANVVGNFA